MSEIDAVFSVLSGTRAGECCMLLCPILQLQQKMLVLSFKSLYDPVSFHRIVDVKVSALESQILQ